MATEATVRDLQGLKLTPNGAAVATEGARPKEVTATTDAKKNKRNRRHRRRRTVDDNKFQIEQQEDKGSQLEEEEVVGEDLEMPMGGGLSQLNGGGETRRVADFSMEADVAKRFMEALEKEEEEEEKEMTGGGATTEEVEAPPRTDAGEKAGKRAGARRRRRKRKKQRSPDKMTENKENKAEQHRLDEGEGQGPSDDDEGDGDIGRGRKYIWRNVVKSGAVKKCVLVEGKEDGGRPTAGDVVLVRSQGKLRDGTIVDDHSTLVFNVGEHEVIEGLDLAVRSMHKNELSILSVKPEAAYGQQGRKGDIPGEARITYLFGLMHFEKQKEVKQQNSAKARATFCYCCCRSAN